MGSEYMWIDAPKSPASSYSISESLIWTPTPGLPFQKSAGTMWKITTANGLLQKTT